MRILKQVVSLMLFIVLVSGANATPLPPGISVSVDAVRSAYTRTDKLQVKVTYTNTSNVPIRFLKWNTALEGIVGYDFFDISIDGIALHYIGRHAKRLPPTESDYITIASNSSIDVVVDLEGAYPLHEQGEYLISYKSVGLSKISTSSTLGAGGAVINLVENKPIRLIKRTPIIDSSCNSTQVAQINEALGIAETIAIRASRDLDNAPANQRSNARRYVEWFGAYNPTFYDSVATGMRRIADALINQRIGFDCTCDDPRRENLFAFVFTNDPFNMNVCPVFFRVAASGTDSRSGTIVHEISHFNVVAATDDFSSALDQSGSRRLARTSPASAIRNANAFEYFAENTPFLSMPAPAANPQPQPGQPSGSGISFSAVTVSTDSPAEGSQMEVSGSVENEASVSLSSVTLTAYISSRSTISTTDQSIGTASLGSLSSGASRAFTIDARIPDGDGQRFIGVCATASSSQGTKQACSVGVAVEVVDGIAIAPIINLLLDE